MDDRFNIDSVGNEEVALEDKFEKAEDELEEREYDYSDSSNVTKFLEAFSELIRLDPNTNDCIVTSRFGNLLHVLVGSATARQRTDQGSGLAPLVYALVHANPALLKQVSAKNGYNPLFQAIKDFSPRRRKNIPRGTTPDKPMLVVSMISACSDSEATSLHRDCLDAALRMKFKQDDEKTSLHLGFQRKLDPEILQMLVRHATIETLAVQDKDGHTPMHHAVRFNELSDARVSIIRMFLERDNEALQRSSGHGRLFLDIVNNWGLSVYREHETSRQVALERFAAEESKQKSEQSKSSEVKNEPVFRESRGAGRTHESQKPPTARDSSKTRAGRDGDGGEEQLDDREKRRREKKEEERRQMEMRKEEEARKQSSSVRFREGDQRRDAQTVTNNDGGDIVTSLRPKDHQENVGRPRTDLKAFAITQRGHSPTKSTKRPTTVPVSQEVLDENRAIKEKIEQQMRNSTTILLELKLHYLRTRDAELAIAFIYGKNKEDKLISFDYDRLPQHMLLRTFVERFGKDKRSGLQFDEILQYVSFPHVKVDPGRRPKKPPNDQDDGDLYETLGGQGRRDMVYFFDWLYDKGVRHIIRVSVVDSGDSTGREVHSDEAIQKSLEKFVVEQLDWQKTDLCPQTILHVSSKAKVKREPTHNGFETTKSSLDRPLTELVLRWSGNNAVLRAWSESEGLPLLTQMSRIFLYVPPPSQLYDSQQWIEQRIHDFEGRLNRTRGERGLPHIRVFRRDASTDEERKVPSEGGPRLASSTTVKGVHSHRWLKSTDRFSSTMNEFWAATLKYAEQRIPEAQKDIIVALIDDGVDMFDKAFTGQVLEGKSFDYHSGLRPPYSSARGHGTVMASMILRVCPMAKIYPIRLKTYATADGKNQIVMDSAAQAIEAALDKKATIISMSWTLPMSNENSPAKDNLHEILRQAVDAGALMFCSAPDSGKFTTLDYPSGPWPQKFFRIGAANADGTVFNWTPDDTSYVLPGVDVVKEQYGSGVSRSDRITSKVSECQYETGSSVATALGAGLAAMVLYCVKAAFLLLHIANVNKGNTNVIGTAIKFADLDHLAKPEGMRWAFSQLGKLTKDNFIPVWEQLDPVSDAMKQLLSKGIAEAIRDGKDADMERFWDFASSLVQAAKKNHN